MRRFYSFLCLPLLIMAASSCQFDDTELQNSIDDLTSRVEALEDFQEQVQGDIASLQEIISKLDSSVTVNNVVDNGDGSWTINFSDGTSVIIRNGQDGEDGLTPPSITVVEEDGTYYWAYENADGTTEFIRDGDGNKIPVTGEAPQVRINDDGYWEISSDGGKTWEDTGVKAEGGDGDSFFSEVYVEGGILYLVLADGTVIEVPMTAELMFDFGTDGDTLYFAAGESQTMEYTMSGAESYTITKPDGWRASIEGNGLVITAPVAENTFAETEGVVSVILFAENGQTFLAEQPVKIGEKPVEILDYVKFSITPTPGKTNVLLTIFPNNMDITYIATAVEASVIDSSTDEQIMNDIIAQYDEQQLQAEILIGMMFDHEITGLEPETDYYAVAFGVDADARAYNTYLFKVPFTTTGDVSYSDAYVTGNINHWWHGDDLVLHNGQYFYITNFLNPVITYIDFEFNDSAASCYWLVSSGDLTASADLYETTISTGSVLSKGSPAPYKYVRYGQYTISVIGVDADGQYGEMYTALIDVTEDGKSQDYELFDEYFNNNPIAY